MKLSDYVADFISKLSKPRPGTCDSDVNVYASSQTRVYTVCGAGAMHLNDSICHHPGIKAIAMHHEQAAAFAAEADARVTNKIGVVCVTAGPGGSNAVTGIACAYVDSIPMLVIAGQVQKSTMTHRIPAVHPDWSLHQLYGDMAATGSLPINDGARQSGMNELPMADIVRPVTKYAVTIVDPKSIKWFLQRVVHLAVTGRQGPVFVEIPLDVQAAEIDPETLIGFSDEIIAKDISNEIAAAISLLQSAQRPILLIGNGIRLSGAEGALGRFLDRYEMPVVASWGARDIYPDALGSCGIFGDRQSNWAVQNADLILAVGTRLSYPQTGHHRDLFAPNARKIVVDIDYQEAAKLKPDVTVVADAKAFLGSFPHDLSIKSWPEWLHECRCHGDSERTFGSKDGINAYHFIDQLSEHLSDDAIVITDVGFCFIPTFQSLKLKPGQRLIHSHGISPMGWAIPAAVGAAFAAPGRQIVCLTGDGGAMMNLQELQTIAHHNLPISIFVYANNGYATMQLTQNNHFGREAVSSPESGVSCPDFMDIGAAFGIQTASSRSVAFVAELAERDEEPWLIVMPMAPNQVIAPRVQSRMENGKFVPAPIDHMWPPLERPEAAE